ncbi:membrane protein [Microbacterium phage Zooman]|nr:membrane protein [Microbacterium phage Zooman]
MTNKTKTPKAPYPYAYTNGDRWVLFGINVALILSVLIGNIFALPFFNLLFYALLVGEILYVIVTILRVVDHTNHRVVDLIARIESVEKAEKP